MAYSYRVLPGGRRVAETTQVNETLEGSAADVLNHVGTDAAEARRYLDAENQRDKPRKGLVEKLEKLANPDA